MELQDRQRIVNLLESLPAPLVRQVLDFTTTLHQEFVEQAGQGEPGLSYEWTDEDIREWMNSAFEHMESECPWDEPAGDSSNAQPG